MPFTLGAMGFGDEVTVSDGALGEEILAVVGVGVTAKGAEGAVSTGVKTVGGTGGLGPPSSFGDGSSAMVKESSR